VSKELKPADPVAFKEATAKLVRTCLQAILVRYVPSTKHLPSRVIASTPGGGHLVVSFNHAGDVGGSKDERDAYAAAALALQAELGWDKTHDLAMGGIVGGDYVFVQVPKVPPAVDPPRYTVEGVEVLDNGKPVIEITRWVGEHHRVNMGPYDAGRLRHFIVQLLNRWPLPDLAPGEFPDPSEPVKL
jgi:hypothetical protein